MMKREHLHREGFWPLSGIKSVDGWMMVMSQDYDDDRFYKNNYGAYHDDYGYRSFAVSPYSSSFIPTQARFEWLIKSGKGFEREPMTRTTHDGRVVEHSANWTNESIDREIANASS